jgi:predicted RNA-binding protein with RPS1 domain
MKNFPELTGDCIREFQRNLVRLRRQKIFAEVRGGCASIEITNEGAGWHLHAHMLLDVPFLDIAKVAILWASLVKQQFAIVHISDLRATDYVREVSKYVVKGNELARWPAKDLIEFLTAIHGRRFFFQFGSLRDAREAIALEIEKNRPEKQSCECGCQEFDYETEAMSVMREIEQSHGVFRKRKKRF